MITPTVTRVYSYGLQRISQDVWSSSGWGRSFYGYDGQGSVRFLTAPNGLVTDRYDYDAFGNVLSRSGNTPNHYLFCGEQFDEDLKLYNLRSRYYNPDSGRFWTQDSFEGFFDDPASLHKYTYAQNNPANMTDPSGHFSLGEMNFTVGLAPLVSTMVVDQFQGAMAYASGLVGGPNNAGGTRPGTDSQGMAYMIQGNTPNAVRFSPPNFAQVMRMVPYMMLPNPYVEVPCDQCMVREAHGFLPLVDPFEPLTHDPMFDIINQMSHWPLDLRSTPAFPSLNPSPIAVAEPLLQDVNTKLTSAAVEWLNRQVAASKRAQQEYSGSGDGVAYNNLRHLGYDFKKGASNFATGALRTQQSLVGGALSDLAEIDRNPVNWIYDKIASPWQSLGYWSIRPWEKLQNKAHKAYDDIDKILHDPDAAQQTIGGLTILVEMMLAARAAENAVAEAKFPPCTRPTQAGEKLKVPFQRPQAPLVEPPPLPKQAVAKRIPQVGDSPHLIRWDPLNPGRPSPKWSVDTGGFKTGTPTANGGMRNAPEFWKQWLDKNPETISPGNKWLIEQLQVNPRGPSPRVDAQWVQYFPEQTPYLRDTIVHHHVDQGAFAIPVPAQTHVGSGGPWHAK